MPKIKEEDKMAHIHQRAIVAEEFLDTAQQYIRGLSNELRFIKKISKPKEEEPQGTNSPL